MKERYILVLNKRTKKTKLALAANDSAHAQAQALDIVRAFNADGCSLTYGTCKDTDLSRLFHGLAFNTFTHKSCYSWTSTECNKVPCCYVFGERFYLRNVILRYLDIPKDNLITKNSCKCASCVNPYHFAYVTEKNEKLSSGDLKLLVAYRSQGAGVSQIASALKVHRSTIYRRLKDEPLPSRT
jgi:hypothetical protein